MVGLLTLPMASQVGLHGLFTLLLCINSESDWEAGWCAFVLLFLWLSGEKHPSSEFSMLHLES